MMGFSRTFYGFWVFSDNLMWLCVFEEPRVFQEVFVVATLQSTGGVWGSKAHSESLP